MDFKLNSEARKVAELLERSKVMRRLAWGMILTIPITAAVWKMADIINAPAQLVR